MIINSTNFFNFYVIRPFSLELSVKEKILALACSILLAPLTLGIVHIVAAIRIDRKVKHLLMNQVVENQKSFEKNAEKTHQAAISSLFSSSTPEMSLPIDIVQVPSFIQEKFILQFYAQKMPKKEDVEVPFRDGESWEKIKWVKWVDLSAVEKIELNNHYAHPHNKISNTFFSRLFIDISFSGPAILGDYLPEDPRWAHGSDHCVRTALFSPIFALLYAKYHPSHDASFEDLFFCMILGAGHDISRQTEGTDVYDEKSAETTVGILEELGIKGAKRLEKSRKAIAHKDDKKYEQKSLWAKCLQCADSADFARLLLDLPVQSEIGFNKSREFLDIYHELKLLAENDENRVLKNGLTFKDFVEELDAVRKEMNMLIYATHNRKFRSQASEASKNYFNEVLNCINRVEYPFLYEKLIQAGVIKPIHVLNQQTKLEREFLELYKLLKNEGLDSISIQHLEEIVKAYPPNALNHEAGKLLNELTVDLETRKKNMAAFSCNPASIECYMALKPLDRLVHEKTEEWIRTFSQSELPHVKLEILHYQLMEKLKTNQDLNPETFHQEILEMLELNNQIANPGERNDYIYTTAACSLELVSDLYIASKQPDKAVKALNDAGDKVLLDENKLWPEMSSLDNGPVFIHRGSKKIRRCLIRMAKKEIDSIPVLEVSFELTRKARKQLKNTLNLLNRENLSESNFCFPKKNSKDGKFYTQINGKNVGAKIGLLQYGSDLKIAFPDLNAVIWLGNDSVMWNQYHHVKVLMTEGASLTDCHKALSRIGLAQAMMLSRPEDQYEHNLGKIITFRFPEIAYRKDLRNNNPSQIFNLMDSDQQNQIKEDLNHLNFRPVGRSLLEFVNPQLIEEASQEGLQGFGCYINGGDNLESFAQILSSIIKNGLLSAQERFLSGYIGYGNVTMLNYWQGSGNQVFTSPIGNYLSEQKVPFSKFSLSSPVMILLDVKLMERMPYTYLTDCAGVRNPYLFSPLWLPFPQKPRIWFKGYRIMGGQAKFPDFIDKINGDQGHHSETMFNGEIGPQYIKKLVVHSFEHKFALMKELEKLGVYTINDEPLKASIVVARNFGEI